MKPLNLTPLEIKSLLVKQSVIMDKLKREKVIRSNNNPTGDYAEWLVSTKLNLNLQSNSTRGFDALDSKKLRYQIKGRRITAKNKSHQLSVIRNLDKKHFDFLIAVIFDANWEVSYAAKITHSDINKIASYKEYVNGHILHLPSNIFANPCVEDISDLLRS